MTRRSLRGAIALACSFGSLTLAGAAGAQIPIGPPPPPPSATPATPAKPPVKRVPGPPGVAAVVNGQKIPTSQVEQLAVQLGGAEILERLINNMLVDQEAKKQGVTVTPAEIDARLTQIKQQIAQQPQGGNLDTLLAQSHETLANFKDSLRLRLEADKLMAKKMPPIVAVHARHILVLTANPAGSPTLKPHSDEDAKKLIAKAQDELKSGKSWDEVCKKYSEDPSNKDKGGDLNVIATGQPYDPTFLNAALSLKKGQVTPTPVKSMYGYHLIKVDSTNADPIPADKPQLVAAVNATRQQLLQNSLPAYLTSLQQKAKIVNYFMP